MTESYFECSSLWKVKVTKSRYSSKLILLSTMKNRVKIIFMTISSTVFDFFWPSTIDGCNNYFIEISINLIFQETGIRNTPTILTNLTTLTTWTDQEDKCRNRIVYFVLFCQSFFIWSRSRFFAAAQNPQKSPQSGAETQFFSRCASMKGHKAVWKVIGSQIKEMWLFLETQINPIWSSFQHEYNHSCFFWRIKDFFCMGSLFLLHAITMLLILIFGLRKSWFVNNIGNIC